MSIVYRNGIITPLQPLGYYGSESVATEANDVQLHIAGTNELAKWSKVVQDKKKQETFFGQLFWHITHFSSHIKLYNNFM